MTNIEIFAAYIMPAIVVTVCLVSAWLMVKRDI